MDKEVVVCVQLWEDSEICRDEYYAVPRDRIDGIRGLIRPHGEHSPEAYASVRECGRKLHPELVVDIVEY